jgi:Rrf2 family protein
MLSKTATYGIKATLYIAYISQQNRRVRLPEIANNIDSPHHFTAKIVQQLAKSGLINSIKGPNGGFEMTVDQRINCNIRSIVEVLDGDDLYIKCGLGLHQCNDERPCPIHHIYKSVRAEVINLHTNISIEALAKHLDDIAVLK